MEGDRKAADGGSGRGAVEEMTVEEALRCADLNGVRYSDVPSVSRTLAAEVRRLQSSVQLPAPSYLVRAAALLIAEIERLDRARNEGGIGGGGIAE